ncbi:MAG TPA: peptidylprolyl isomerase [Gemmatimonadales bacterium]|nr:peptidylprolyl isomerase [Gemmatimonadales bacterium]
MNRKLVLLAGAVLGLSACDGFREAMTAHVDVVARAGSQELSVDRFATLLGSSEIPLDKEVARTVADLWINYQLLGLASARGDSLNSPAVVDSAMWMAMMNVRSQKYLQQVSADWLQSDTVAASEERYNQGDLFAARHILFRVPQGASQAQIDSVRTAAESVRAQVTPSNFATMAQRHSSDGSAQQGGYLGIFARGQMVPEFERAVIALAPGEISPLVQTQFGYHIVMRSPFAEVKDDYAQMAMQQTAFKAESTYFARLEDGANIDVKSNIARKVKAVAADADSHLNDRTVLASSTAGEFTAGKLARYVIALPPQAQMRERILAAEDSAAPDIIRFFLRNELVAKQADSANVVLDSTEIGEMRRAYTAAITGAWNGLGVAPAQLADSAQSDSERERLAAQRVNQYVEALLAQQAQFVEVPPPLLFALRDEYESRIVDAGIDRALEAAQRVRVQADSLRAAQQPQSAVPMPGAPADSTGQGS